MAAVLGAWRGFAGAVMGGLVCGGALVVLNHPDFAAQAAAVEAKLAPIDNPQLQTQLRMPVALGLLLPPGVKGAYRAIALFGVLAGMGASMHSFGSTFIQDVILPLRRRPFAPREHIRVLRWAATGVGLFAIFFSTVFEFRDYLQLVTTLIGAIYLGGVGALVIGGLYWKKATVQGAWAAMVAGLVCALLGQVLQHGWPALQPWLLALARPVVVQLHLRGQHLYPVRGRHLHRRLVHLGRGARHRPPAAGAARGQARRRRRRHRARPPQCRGGLANSLIAALEGAYNQGGRHPLRW